MKKVLYICFDCGIMDPSHNKEWIMKYILITKNGRIMQFYIKAVVETYQAINGGTIIEPFLTAAAAVDCIKNDTLSCENDTL